MYMYACMYACNLALYVRLRLHTQIFSSHSPRYPAMWIIIYKNSDTHLPIPFTIIYKDSDTKSSHSTHLVIQTQNLLIPLTSLSRHKISNLHTSSFSCLCVNSVKALRISSVIFARSFWVLSNSSFCLREWRCRKVSISARSDCMCVYVYMCMCVYVYSDCMCVYVYVYLSEWRCHKVSISARSDGMCVYIDI